MVVIPKCEYCKHNEGENKKFGFMWKCKVLGYCVSFGYKRRHKSSEDFQYCKAMFEGKGVFVLDEAKKKDFDKKQKELKKNENITN